MTESEQVRADVQQVFDAVDAADVVVRLCNCPPLMACRHRAPALFPSLSLMSKPITPAPPRLRFFPGPPGQGKWRCRVDTVDISRHKHITTSGLTTEHYRATGPEGWGDTKERAYNAWKAKWRLCMEKP